MNTEMAYLLGMICGNGTVEKNKNETKISISIPHKKLRTDEFHDVKLYVKASLDDINKIIAAKSAKYYNTDYLKNRIKQIKNIHDLFNLHIQYVEGKQTNRLHDIEEYADLVDNVFIWAECNICLKKHIQWMDINEEFNDLISEIICCKDSLIFI